MGAGLCGEAGPGVEGAVGGRLVVAGEVGCLGSRGWEGDSGGV